MTQSGNSHTAKRQSLASWRWAECVLMCVLIGASLVFFITEWEVGVTTRGCLLTIFSPCPMKVCLSCFYLNSKRLSCGRGLYAWVLRTVYIHLRTLRSQLSIRCRTSACLGSHFPQQTPWKQGCFLPSRPPDSPAAWVQSRREPD